MAQKDAQILLRSGLVIAYPEMGNRTPVKTMCIARARALLFPTVERADEEDTRAAHERFAIPFTFKPQLSFPAALIATAGALLRIFLGSLLFAVWGTSSLVAWSTIRNPLCRIGVLLPLFLLFLLSFSLLMLAIAALVRTISLKLR